MLIGSVVLREVSGRGLITPDFAAMGGWVDAIVDGVTLQHSIRYVDLLTVYIYLLAVAPLMIWMLTRRHGGWMVAAFSLVVYLVDVVVPLEPFRLHTVRQIEGGQVTELVLVAPRWLLLFNAGLIMGWHWPQVDRILRRRPVAMTLVLTAAIVVAIRSRAAVARRRAVVGGGPRRSDVPRGGCCPAGNCGDGLDSAFDRSHSRCDRRGTMSRLRQATAAGAIMTMALLAAGSATAAQSASMDGPEAGFAAPGDPYFGEQWYLFNFGQKIAGQLPATPDIDIRAPEAWSVTTGDPEVIVAVVDTGVDVEHPSYASSLWRNAGEVGSGREANGVDDDGNGYIDDWQGWDFRDRDNDPAGIWSHGQSGQLPVEHGTAIASLIAADHDGQDMVGIAPDVTVMPLRVNFGDRYVVEAVEYGIANGARIFSFSFGGTGDFTFAGLGELMAQHPDVLFVSAAMNEGRDITGGQRVPCSYEMANHLCIAAHDETGKLAEFYGGGSGFGAPVHLAAPGDNMLVAQPGLETVWTDNFEADLAAGWIQSGDNELWIADPGSGLDGSAGLANTAGEVGDTNRSTSLLRLSEGIDVADRSTCRLKGYVHAPRGISRASIVVAREAEGPYLSVGGRDSLASVDNLAVRQGFTPFDVMMFTPAHQAAPTELFIGFQFDAVFEKTMDDRAPLMFDDLELRCSTSTPSVSLAYGEGTSYATPITAGVAALVWSEFPQLTAEQVATAIMTGTTPTTALEGFVRTGGRLDAYGALEAAAQLAAGTGEPASDEAGEDTMKLPGSDGADSIISIGGLIHGLVPPSPENVPVPPSCRGICTGAEDGRAQAATGEGGIDESLDRAAENLPETSPLREAREQGYPWWQIGLAGGITVVVVGIGLAAFVPTAGTVGAAGAGAGAAGRRALSNLLRRPRQPAPQHAPVQKFSRIGPTGSGRPPGSGGGGGVGRSRGHRHAKTDKGGEAGNPSSRRQGKPKKTNQQQEQEAAEPKGRQPGDNLDLEI